ncbi:MAG TPA: hypothetical protein VEP90_12615 [Methylomirabilota bacterium]|nr:hypothetical protein [Methylomirabilota bacterium]
MVDATWQVLQSITLESLIDEGRVYGGGLHKMEPKELANVPAVGFLAILQSYSVSTPDTPSSVVLGDRDIVIREKVVSHTLWTHS